jgi:hypothetical protein
MGNNPPSTRIVNPFADGRNLPFLLFNIQFQSVRRNPRTAARGGISKFIEPIFQFGRNSNRHSGRTAH